MRADDELKDLRGREAKAREAILKLAHEVLPVLSDDLACYPAREARQRFVSDPIFAESLDDDTLAKLKVELEERSAVMRDQVMEQLSEDERWLHGLECEGGSRTFAENERLWAPTSLAAELTREILTAYGFPDNPQPPSEYRMPTWFINGKYLPGLAEKYWGLLAEVREIRSRIREVEENTQREALRKRWDSV